MQRIPTDMEDALVAWIQAIHEDATPIWANQDGHRPGLPFVELDIISGPRNIGPAEEIYKEEDTFTYGIRKIATLNVQVFAADAMVRIGAIESAIELPGKMAVLQNAGIAVHGIEGVRDITELLDTAHEPRATADIVISWPEPVDDTPGEIRSVHVTGTVGGRTVDRTIDIEE